MEIESIYTETYHYHDIGRANLIQSIMPTATHSLECFDLTRSEVDASLEHESDEYRAWILGNPAVGDRFFGEGNDVAVVERVPDARAEVTAVVDGWHWTPADRVWAYDIHTLAERWVDVGDIDASTWVGDIDPEGANIQILRLRDGHYILVQSIDAEVTDGR